MVSPEMSAQDKKWWTDDRYAIYDLNVNSVAAYPEHEEILDLTTAGTTYTAKGYAYAGGGRRITRVEISLDKGKCIVFCPTNSYIYRANNLLIVSSMAARRYRIRRRQIPRMGGRSLRG